MYRPPLETLDRRRTRSFARRRRHSSIVTGAALGLLVVLLALVAFGVASVLAHRQPATHAPSTVAAAATPPASAVASAASVASDTLASDTPTDAAETTPGRPATITVAAVGDMIFDRSVRDLIRAQGAEAPFENVAEQLSSADITLGNLESMLSNLGSADASKAATFRGDPRAVAGLEAAGFDFLSMANNHVLDLGPKALLDTIARLDSAGIGHAGAGADQKAAFAPAAAERNGANVAYLAFSNVVPESFMMAADRPGLASSRWDMSRVERAIRAAKKTHDYVIVSFHWGTEYDESADKTQIDDAHKAIDAGADLVASSHPHVIQGVETYKGRLIAYSLGDFVFDHFSRKTGESFILNAEIGPDGVANATAVPVYLDSSGRPDVVTGDEATVILARLKKLSAPLGGNVVVEGDTARIEP